MTTCVWCDWPRIVRDGDHADWCPQDDAEKASALFLATGGGPNDSRPDALAIRWANRTAEVTP